jgi:hypothetical protein
MISHHNRHNVPNITTTKLWLLLYRPIRLC